MTKYEQLAINAVKRTDCDANINPKLAWKIEAYKMFCEKKSSAKKCCPRNAFLGLCEEGLIKGIPKEKYITKPNSLNKKYVLDGYKCLKDNDTDIKPRELWKQIGMGEKAYNSQMDVLCGLFKAGLLNI
ncbi:hypothetical protein LAV35_10410 [Clostridium sporogenes]|uniref:DUF6979 family protein n=1 Tax=Clostridium sporogenes TaxID=1509 RepID=UPI0022388E2D|nr:hypothetical protein [Clostridium sporogenes]MCW6062074.1 hypothetical protein [Clostridium sporogenes]MCW6068596.1 hypothetical protein [Clostridium sporogenes]